MMMLETCLPSTFPDRAGTPLQLGALTLPSRFFLAPLAGYTTLPFRLAVRALGGVGLATTDLVNARALLRFNRKSQELVDTCPTDWPLSTQLYGAEPDELAAAARFMAERGAAVIDINMGCPVHKVCRGGGGSAMMCDPDATVRLVRGVVEAVRLPVTVKMRLGWDDGNWSAPYFARAFEEVGVAGVIIHGRSRAQGFGGSVNLDGIRAVVEAVENIPVIGNGDVRTVADAAHMMHVTGCAGVSIGRGALLNPWIFSQIQRAITSGAAGPPASYGDRLGFMARHFHGLVAQRGERFSCLIFRKVANWYCRVLKPGREIQQRLMRLESVADFDEMMQTLRTRGAPAGWHEAEEPVIAVPRGPISHW